LKIPNKRLNGLPQASERPANGTTPKKRRRRNWARKPHLTTLDQLDQRTLAAQKAKALIAGLESDPDALAMYKIYEKQRRRRRSHLRVALLTEAGPVGFPRAFYTLSAATRFARDNYRRWPHHTNGRNQPPRPRRSRYRPTCASRMRNGKACGWPTTPERLPKTTATFMAVT
jgi:hypothetical protein